MRHSSGKRAVAWVIGTIVLCMVWLCAAQLIWAHRQGFFKPEYPKVELTTLLSKDRLLSEDYKTIFAQTGLGQSAVDALREKGETGNLDILQYQNSFFSHRRVKCSSMLGWFTREDVLVDEKGNPAYGPALADIRPGDIVLSLATHSVGWTHGHAGIAIDRQTTLESQAIGLNSAKVNVNTWRRYANYVVLRIKDGSERVADAVAEFAKNYLYDVPYRLTAGLFGDKAIALDSASFGLQCAYLVWYAWQSVGVDLDADGGKLVTPMDLLLSDQVEIVQIHGIDPHLFMPNG